MQVEPALTGRVSAHPQVSPLEALEERDLAPVIWNTTAYTIQVLGMYSVQLVVCYYI